MVKQGRNPCPYLFWEDGESRCRIHEFEWFKLTPCHEFTQVEDSPDCVCRLGEHVNENRSGYFEKYCQEFQESYLSVQHFQQKIESMITRKKDECKNKKT